VDRENIWRRRAGTLELDSKYLIPFVGDRWRGGGRGRLELDLER
jgi:hypothetical protein